MKRSKLSLALKKKRQRNMTKSETQDLENTLKGEIL